MTWTDITHREHNRDDLRYPSDLRDEEWKLIEPLLPPRVGAAEDGRRSCGRS
jgi:putative transposase